jgi:uncharacterized protein (DUF1778 family)
VHYKKNRKENHIHLRLTDEEMRDLEMASYLDGRSKSDFMRRALSYYLYLREQERERWEQAGRK